MSTRYGASSQKATSMAGVSVSPIVPSKSKRMDILSKALAFSMMRFLCAFGLKIYSKQITFNGGREQRAGKMRVAIVYECDADKDKGTANPLQEQLARVAVDELWNMREHVTTKLQHAHRTAEHEVTCTEPGACLRSKVTHRPGLHVSSSVVVDPLLTCGGRRGARSWVCLSAQPNLSQVGGGRADKSNSTPNRKGRRLTVSSPEEERKRPTALTNKLSVWWQRVYRWCCGGLAHAHVGREGL